MSKAVEENKLRIMITRIQCVTEVYVYIQRI